MARRSIRRREIFMAGGLPVSLRDGSRVGRERGDGEEEDAEYESREWKGERGQGSGKTTREKKSMRKQSRR